MADRTCVDCGAPVARGAMRCRGCYRKATHGTGHRLRPDQSTCPDCGGPKHRQSERCASCAAAARVGVDRVVEIGHVETGRNRAKRLYPVMGDCQRCGDVPAVDRHHIDGNTANNAPENIAFLCRRCHMTVDGRLAAFKAAPRKGHRGGRGRVNPVRDARGRYTTGVAA